MYSWCPNKTITAAMLADLQRVAERFDLSRGNGSYGSDAHETMIAFRGLVEGLFPQPILIRLFALYPSAQIVGHCDPAIQGSRYHIPLQTNPGCWCFHLDEWTRLKAGWVYRMNPAEYHGAVNWGTDVRIHLTIDA